VVITFSMSRVFRLLHVDVQMSGWWVVRRAVKEDWKSNTMDLGEQSAVITSTTLMLVLSAIVWDSGW